MFNIVILSIIAVCLAVVGFVVFRKFPQLANLDINDLPEEKIARKKREIILRRVEQKGQGLREKMKKTSVPFKKIWGQVQLKFRIYVGKIQKLWQHEQVVENQAYDQDKPEEKQEKIVELIHLAENFLKNADYDEAENYFISAISLNPKNAAAYRGLADTYLAKNELEEARQTYLYLTRLEPDDDSVFVKLAEIAESQGDLEEAVDYYQKAVLINDSFAPRFFHLTELLIKLEQPDVAKESIVQAVELESQNPKYLDLFIETAIICDDKDLAIQGMEKLRAVNPDNQKLDGFRERIGKMR